MEIVIAILAAALFSTAPLLIIMNRVDKTISLLADAVEKIYNLKEKVDNEAVRTDRLTIGVNRAVEDIRLHKAAIDNLIHEINKIKNNEKE